MRKIKEVMWECVHCGHMSPAGYTCERCNRDTVYGKKTEIEELLQLDMELANIPEPDMSMFNEPLGKDLEKMDIAPFDVHPIREGQILLLSQEIREVVVLKDWGQGSWLVAPVSRFHIPATTFEVLTTSDDGEPKVLQIWNVCITKDLERSWDHGQISNLDIARTMLAISLTGGEIPEIARPYIGEPITDPYDVRVGYQEEEMETFSRLRRTS